MPRAAKSCKRSMSRSALATDQSISLVVISKFSGISRSCMVPSMSMGMSDATTQPAIIASMNFLMVLRTTEESNTQMCADVMVFTYLLYCTMALLLMAEVAL